MSGYAPDNRPRLQASVRFFARPESFTLECPRCGQVHRIRKGRPTSCWNPDTARFTCINMKCRKTYVIGLLAWPVSVGGRNTATTTPRDQIPTPRQLAQLRKEGGGWWLPESERQRFSVVEEANLTLEQERPDDQDED